jgi:hypothetical protein
MENSYYALLSMATYQQDALLEEAMRGRSIQVAEYVSTSG